MDPEATLLKAEESIKDKDDEGAVFYLSNYKKWRRGNGFEPSVKIIYKDENDSEMDFIGSLAGDYFFNKLTDRYKKTFNTTFVED